MKRPAPICACMLAAAALVPGLALGADPRIREVPFDAAAVVTVPVQLGVTTMVQFGALERVRTVAPSQGSECSQPSQPWCVSWPADASFLFIHPRSLARYPLSLAVVTDRHSYSLVFEVVAGRSARIPVHRLTFTYPPAKVGAEAPQPDTGDRAGAILAATRLKVEPVPVNADYSIAFGENSGELAPALVFDDGRFTYIKWPGNREIPAVFEVRADGSENVVNVRMQGDLIVVDRIARSLMLRSGKSVANIRNESFDAEGLPPVQGASVLGVARKDRP